MQTGAMNHPARNPLKALRIPFPYTDAAADDWLALVAKTAEQQGRPVHFAIRSAQVALARRSPILIGNFRRIGGFWANRLFLMPVT